MVLNSQKNNNGMTLKERFHLWLLSFKSEVSKTTKIGAKMLSASQSNTRLQEVYKDLGVWFTEQVESGNINVQDKNITDLIRQVKDLQDQLAGYENEVQEIKKS